MFVFHNSRRSRNVVSEPSESMSREIAEISARHSEEVHRH